MHVGTKTCFLGPGSRITGTVAGPKSHILIAGIIEGTVTARSVFIQESGKINGHLRAETIEIAGYFNGRIEAMQVTLLGGSQTDATIYHNELNIDPAASVRGLQPWRPSGYIKSLRKTW